MGSSSSIMRAAVLLAVVAVATGAPKFSKKALSTPLSRGGGKIVGGSFAQVTVVGLSRFPILQLTTGSRRSCLIFTPLTNKKRLVFHGETSSGWGQSLRIATTTTSTGTGGGLMPMPVSNGLTGETTSPTISTDRTA